MMNVLHRLAALGAFAALVSMAPPIQAQSSVPVTEFDRQLARIDLGISGAGIFTTRTSGMNYLQQNVTLSPSNTLGALVTVRYTKSPLVGVELNYSYVRYTDDFTGTNSAAVIKGTTPFVLGIQTKLNEYTVGYVAHTPHYFGVQPFISAGLGLLAYHPTAGGGQGFLPQAEAAYYYTLGADAPLNDKFGFRASFHQVFSLAPDYKTNYLRNSGHALTSEPTLGFYVRF